MQSNLYAYIPRDESFSVYDLVLGPGCPGRGKVGSSVQVWVRPPPEHPTTSGTGDKKGGGWRRQQQLRVVKFDTAGLSAKACEYLTEICKTWPNGVPTEQFAKEFLHALERENEAAAAAAAEPTVGAADKLDAYSFSFTTKVLAELQTIGLEHMVAVDDDLRSLTLRVVDQGARAHDVVISLSPTHTRGTITGVSCDLPVTLFDRGRTDKLKISDVYRKFCASVLSLQPLWDELDEIDAMYPSVLGNNKSSAARRIQLTNNVTFQFELNIPSPREVPTYWFLGQASASAAPKAKFEEYCQKGWDNTRPVTHNVQSALGEFLPTQASTGDDAARGFAEKGSDAQMDTEAVISHNECGICFSLDLDGKIPTVACENGNCGRVYHEACLFEYFQNEGAAAGGGVEGSGSVAFGKCPYCNQPMSVRVTKSHN